jgi:tRNA-specific 2-thiouridylase
VLVAMSGGVDSSVVAAILKQHGCQVVGCFMRLGSEESVESCDLDAPTASPLKPQASSPKPHQGCCSVNDASDARLVAAMLDIPFYVLNFKKDFDRIINYFVDEYNAGRTPNPCVRCNDWLKFGKLHDYAQSIDCDYVASGHYARITRSPLHATQLRRGKDRGKDQSYVLFGTSRERLEHLCLPIGDMEKTEVRQIAEDCNLPVFNKPDSQEICFVPDNDYAKLVEHRSPDTFADGDVVDRQGQIVGHHEGHQHFTIGQRRGVGVALGYPIYVVDKNPLTNTVTVGNKNDLLSVGCTASQSNWLIDEVARDNWRSCAVKVRYNSEPVPAQVRASDGDKLEVCFDEPISAVAPGQAVVCYDGDVVLGGGWIDEVQKTQTTPVTISPCSMI